MTTLQNRPNTALLVVDVQNGVVERAHARDAVVANAALVSDAHTKEDQTAWGAPPGRTAGTVETKDVDVGDGS